MELKYKINLSINSDAVYDVGVDLKYFEEELHSILISYGDCITRCASYTFENGNNILFAVVALMKMFPSFNYMLYNLEIINKKGESVELLNFTR